MEGLDRNRRRELEYVPNYEMYFKNGFVYGYSIRKRIKVKGNDDLKTSKNMDTAKKLEG